VARAGDNLAGDVGRYQVGLLDQKGTARLLSGQDRPMLGRKASISTTRSVTFGNCAA
jgi:hypothetical protein